MKRNYRYLGLLVFTVSGFLLWNHSATEEPLVIDQVASTEVETGDTGPTRALALPAQQTMLTEEKSVLPEKLRRSTDMPKGLSQKDWDSIQGAMHHFQHTIRENDGLHWARNVGEKYRAKIDDRGVNVDPDGGGWQWGLELRSYAAGGEKVEIKPATARKADGQRIDLDRGMLTEWYLNDHGGIEHGWTIQKPLGKSENVTFQLAPRGDYSVAVAEDQKSAIFIDASGIERIRYAALKAWDATGKALKATFSSGKKTGELHLALNMKGAVYPIVVDPLIQQIIAPPQGMRSDVSKQEFGQSVAISGDTVVVGSRYGGFFTEAGEAMVFVRSGNTWSQQAYLTASNAGLGDFFGSAVAISGETIVVGAYAEDSIARGVNGNEADNSASFAGAAYVFTRSGSTWSQQAYLKASNAEAGDVFGRSVAISGETIVVGASDETSAATGVNGNQSDNSAVVAGAAYVFTRSGSTWSQQAYLKASNTGGLDFFGGSVAISGEIVVVGAVGENSAGAGAYGNQGDNSAPSAGAVYVFVRSGSTWSQEVYLKASNPQARDLFGRSVAISGETVVVGADNEDSAAKGVDGSQGDNSEQDSGAAYVFRRNIGVWSQQAYLKASNTDDFSFFGNAVAISGETIVVGSLGEASAARGVNGNESDNSSPFAGAVYVFTRDLSSWSQQAYLKASNTDGGDFFGSSVAIAGDTLMVGAYGEDGVAAGVTGNQSDNSTKDAGAGYVFTRSGSTWSQQAYLKAPGASEADKFGEAVAVSGETIVVGAGGEDSSATGVNGNPADNTAVDSGAAYVFVKSVRGWALEAYLKANNTGAGDRFGNAVAISGETIVVGAFGEDRAASGVNNNVGDDLAGNSGAAYVFRRSGSTWSQQAYLKASNTDAGDGFGGQVAISEETIVVGAQGEKSSARGVNGDQTNNSASFAGAAYVFKRNAGEWSQQAYLKASNTEGGYSFGSAVSISGETIVVGAFGESSAATGVDGNQNDNSVALAGAAYVFKRNAESWSQQAYLKASNTGLFGLFGVSLAISGETIVVGATGEGSESTGVNGNQNNNNAGNSGAAYVFMRSGSTWSQQAYLKASNTEESDFFGTSVAISGEMIVVGAVGEDSLATGQNTTEIDDLANGSGAAYVFNRTGSIWAQTKYLKSSSGARLGEQFGESVAVAGNTIVIGADTEANTVSVYTETTYAVWAAAYFPNLSAANAAPGFDADGDGMTNEQECLAGTNPTLSTSVLRAISFEITPGNLSLSFQTVPLKRYRLTRSTDLVRFTVVSGYENIFSDFTTLSINIRSLIGQGAPAYYRLEVLP
jgi:hypothetical protein